MQDSYTLRCIPQVHGVVNDTLKFVRGIIETEMNSGTDNPMIFIDENGDGDIVSGGNFHGEYPVSSTTLSAVYTLTILQAKALDYLAIAVHELSSISERRTERLTNPALSELPVSYCCVQFPIFYSL